MKFKSAMSSHADSGFLDGQLLVAMPGMPDQRFARAVIYVCAHSADGAMGIVINKKARKVTLPELLAQLRLVDESQAIRLPRRVGAMRVLDGGPVDAQRGFVLHSPDYHADDATLAVDDDVSLTATIDVLKAIVEGEGPEQAVLALGYAGWSPGQLETEILNNGWLTCPADKELLFGEDLKGKYARAMDKLGIDLGMLVSNAGHG